MAILQSLILALSLFGAHVQSQAITTGQQIQYVGHSFHWFIPTPIATLAAEANITGHVTVGIDRIGASTPMQHWNAGGDAGNPVKTVLKEGRASVLTLSTQLFIPEQGIENFAKLAWENRKDMRVMVQETWLPLGDPLAGRDAATWENLRDIKSGIQEPYQARLREQLSGLNRQFGGVEFCVLVPIWEAVLTLRQEVVLGRVPGVSTQGALFADWLGHARKPLEDLVTYVWFGAIYKRNPLGLKSIAAGNITQAEVLQRIAWDILTKESLGGVYGAARKPRGRRSF